MIERTGVEQQGEALLQLRCTPDSPKFIVHVDAPERSLSAEYRKVLTLALIKDDA